MVGLASGTARVCVSTLCLESIRSGWRWPTLWALKQPMTSGSAAGQDMLWGPQLSHSEHEDTVYFQGPLPLDCSSSPSLKEHDTVLQHQQFQWQIVFLPFNLSAKFRRVTKSAKDLAKLRIVKLMVQVNEDDVAGFDELRHPWSWRWFETEMFLRFPDVMLFPARSQRWYFLSKTKQSDEKMGQKSIVWISAILLFFLLWQCVGKHTNVLAVKRVLTLQKWGLLKTALRHPSCTVQDKCVTCWWSEMCCGKWGATHWAWLAVCWYLLCGKSSNPSIWKKAT